MKFKNYLLVEMSLEKAMLFAKERHKDQIRKTTKDPYVVHPIGVFSLLRSLRIKDVVVLVASFLHDTLEDTKTTYNEIKKEFNAEVADLVKQLTSDQKEIEKMGKPEYLLKKMIEMSDNALTIKLADRLHNLSDIKVGSKNFSDKMWSQTTYIIKRLRTERVLTSTHKKLIRMIEKRLSEYKPKGAQYEI
jgi:(p)ppGpp synthase/HD superfamily hydrolase